MSVLLAVNAYQASGAAAGRNARALASLRRLRGVQLLNVQPVDDPHKVEGVATAALLKRDSVTVTGLRGRRTPVVADIFDAAARVAMAAEVEYFAFANSDIIVTQEAIDVIGSVRRAAYVFSRTEVEPGTREPLGVMTYGTDLFAIRPGWWAANRRRFRAYLLGDRVWDNVFTAIVLSHSDGLLLNREPWILHERHDSGAEGSPFAAYTGMLANLDRFYFSMWAEYHHGLLAARARGASAGDEAALRTRAFRSRQTPGARAVHFARALKTRLVYRLQAPARRRAQARAAGG